MEMMLSSSIIIKNLHLRSGIMLKGKRVNYFIWNLKNNENEKNIEKYNNYIGLAAGTSWKGCIRLQGHDKSRGTLRRFQYDKQGRSFVIRIGGFDKWWFLF